MTNRIPFTQYGQDGPLLIFLHANGYPPACYQPLLNRLGQKYRVLALRQRPLWPHSDPAALKDWRPLSQDLLDFLAQENVTEPALCVGHSVGGIAALRAALWQPGRFAALALLDPVLFPPGRVRLFQLARWLGLSERIHPLIPAARRRRDRFDDLERLFQGFRRKAVFRYFSDESLRAYIQGIACPQDDGSWRLCYSKAWEIRIYVTGLWRDMEIWRALPALDVPTRIVRGAETDTFWASTAALVQKKNPRIDILTLTEATHLVPLERPDETAAAIESHFGSIV